MMHVLNFSKEQWYEFGLIVGFSLQDIADCQLSLSVLSGYHNTLLQKWLSTDYTASWFSVMTAVKTMLPPACGYADSIIQLYPKLVDSTEKELKDIEEIIPPIVVFTLSSQIPIIATQSEEMGVDRAITNASRVVDVRFNDIEAVLRANTEELKKISNSEEYWKRQLQLDEDLICAILNQNQKLEKVLKSTEKLCQDLFQRNEELNALINKVEKEWTIINIMDQKRENKSSVFEELDKQQFRLKRLKSKNAERLAEICKIPSKVSTLKDDAKRNRDMCNNAKRSMVETMKRQHRLLEKYSALLNASQDRLNIVDKKMLELLALWKDYFSRTAKAAAIGAVVGAVAGLALVVLSGGTGLPAYIAAGAAAGVGGAAVGAIYGWSSYEHEGRRNADIIRNEAVKSNEKRIRLTDMCTDISNRLERQLSSY